MRMFITSKNKYLSNDMKFFWTCSIPLTLKTLKTYNTTPKISLLLIYDLQSEDWINTYYMLMGFLKARRPPKESNEMKCTNENMTWNTQDTNLSSYVPKANVDHTISDQGTGISTLYHSATTPRTPMCHFMDWSHPCYLSYITTDPLGLRWCGSFNTCVVYPQTINNTCDQWHTHFRCFLRSQLFSFLVLWL